MSTTPRILAAPLAMFVLASCVDLPADHVAASRASSAMAPPAQRSASVLTAGLARIALRDTLQRRHLHERAAIRADLFVDPKPGVSLGEARNLVVTADALTFDYHEDQLVQINPGWSHTQERRRTSGRIEHRFRTESYCGGVGAFVDKHGRYFSPMGIRTPQGLYAWQDQRDAQRFCDAWNHLVQEAQRDGTDDMLVFAANARAWRERPETRPAEPPGWDRQRILAEGAYRERDFIRALEHFEAGLRLHPAWAAGWFNAALLYEALGEYDYASNRMRRYLALAPNAPDAGQAREKLIVWDHKLRRQ